MIGSAFLRQNARLLGFGIFMCFLSSAGQTFFISLFGGEIRAAFDLSHGEFGSIYSAATLTSAAVLIWGGMLIDRMRLPLYCTGVLCGLALAAIVMASTPGLVVLGIAIFMLRFFGQGLTSHAAMTTLARNFRVERGRVVSIAALGYTLGEAVLPALVVAALVFLTWRQTWLATAVFVFASLVLVLWLLRARERQPAPQAVASADGVVIVDPTLKQVLRDPGLWLRLPALLAPSFISTGLIFHQVHLVNEQGWTMSALASAYSVYAVCAVAANLGAGVLVDRFSARRMVGVFLGPLVLSCLSLAALDAAFGVYIFMGLLGVSSGLTLVLLGSLWAELYGVTHLGAIKAFGQSAMVFSTGLAPGAMGLAVDAGQTMAAIAIACATYCVVASGLTVLARPRAATAG